LLKYNLGNVLLNNAIIKKSIYPFLFFKENVVHLFVRLHIRYMFCPPNSSYSFQGPSWSWSFGSWIYGYLCNQCPLPLMLWVRIPLNWGVLDTALCDIVCQWLAAGQWFSSGTLLSSTNKTDSHDITELVLKVALNAIIGISFQDICTYTKVVKSMRIIIFFKLLVLSVIHFLWNFICFIHLTPLTDIKLEAFYFTGYLYMY